MVRKRKTKEEEKQEPFCFFCDRQFKVGVWLRCAGAQGAGGQPGGVTFHVAWLAAEVAVLRHASGVHSQRRSDTQLAVLTSFFLSPLPAGAAARGQQLLALPCMPPPLMHLGCRVSRLVVPAG